MGEGEGSSVVEAGTMITTINQETLNKILEDGSEMQELITEVYDWLYNSGHLYIDGPEAITDHPEFAELMARMREWAKKERN